LELAVSDDYQQKSYSISNAERIYVCQRPTVVAQIGTIAGLEPEVEMLEMLAQARSSKRGN
jgi:hypothetical protein